MKILSNSELSQTSGGGIPLFVGIVLGAIALGSFIIGCNESQEANCYYTDDEGNECPCEP